MEISRRQRDIYGYTFRIDMWDICIYSFSFMLYIYSIYIYVAHIYYILSMYNIYKHIYVCVYAYL